MSSTSGTPSGSVDFRDGANDLGSVALSVVSGTAQAQLTVPNTTFSQDSNALSAGFHTITALYSGNDTFAHSTGKLSQVVTAGTTTALALAASSVNPSDFGQAVSFVATVATIAPASGTVTGVVDFTVDGGSPVSVPLHKGQATFTTRGLAVGTHTITAAYAGNAAFSASSAASPLQQVVLTATHTALTASVNPVVTSNTVTYTATVGAITVSPPGGQAVQGKAASTTVPTGTIDFYQDGTQMASVAVNASGTAQWSTSYSAAGSHKIKAVYEGDANFGSSTSAVLTERVADTNVATQVQLSASPNPAVAGAPLTFRAYVSAVSPSATGGGSTTSAGSRALPVSFGYPDSASSRRRHGHGHVLRGLDEHHAVGHSHARTQRHGHLYNFHAQPGDLRFDRRLQRGRQFRRKHVGCLHGNRRGPDARQRDRFGDTFQQAGPVPDQRGRPEYHALLLRDLVLLGYRSGGFLLRGPHEIRRHRHHVGLVRLEWGDAAGDRLDRGRGKPEGKRNPDRGRYSGDDHRYGRFESGLQRVRHALQLCSLRHQLERTACRAAERYRPGEHLHPIHRSDDRSGVLCRWWYPRFRLDAFNYRNGAPCHRNHSDRCQQRVGHRSPPSAICRLEPGQFEPLEAWRPSRFVAHLSPE